MSISRHRVVHPQDPESGRAAAEQALEQGLTFRVRTGEGAWLACRPRRVFDFNNGSFQVSGTLPEDVVGGIASRFTLLLSPGPDGRNILITRYEPDFDAEFPELGLSG